MRLVPPSVGIGASLLLATAAWAQAPAGPTFQVNTYTTSRQAYASVAMSPQGDFMVVWDNRFQAGQSDVQARGFGRNGAATSAEFRVNAFTTSFQSVLGARAAGLDARGNAVVVWDDFRNPGGTDTFARRVSSAGVPLGTDFLVNAVIAGSQPPDGVAVLRNGRFVVVWEDFAGYDLFARRFDESGNPLGADFRVNTYTTGTQ